MATGVPDDLPAAPESAAAALMGTPGNVPVGPVRPVLTAVEALLQPPTRPQFLVLPT